MNFSDLKKQMSKLDGVVEELKKKEAKSSNVDERFFKPTKDSAGNVSCAIRFLPQLDFSKSPYVKKFGHFIKKSEKTFICNCANTGKKDGECPVCAKAKPYWTEYWMHRNQTGNKDHPLCKEALKGANLYTATTQIVTNIMVVTNSADPSTEGKVFLYNVPKTVMEKYNQKLFPKDDLDEPVVIYHPLEGRNFKLDGCTKKVNDDISYIDYGASYFYDKTTPISDSEDIIMKVLNETHDLDKFLEESKIDLDDINKRFNEFKKFIGESVDEPKYEKPKEKTPEPEKEDEPEDDIEEMDMDDIDAMFDS